MFRGFGDITSDQITIAGNLYRWWDDIPERPLVRVALGPYYMPNTYAALMVLQRLGYRFSGQEIMPEREDYDYYQTVLVNRAPFQWGNRFSPIYYNYAEQFNRAKSDVLEQQGIFRTWLRYRENADLDNLVESNAWVSASVNLAKQAEGQLFSLINELGPLAYGQTPSSVLGDIPSWTFSPSSIPRAVPPAVFTIIPPAQTQVIDLSQITTTEQAQTVLERAQSQGAPQEILNVISSVKEQLSQAQFFQEPIFQEPITQGIISYQPTEVLAAGFPWWAWLVLGGVGLAIIGGKKSKGKRMK